MPPPQHCYSSPAAGPVLDATAFPYLIDLIFTLATDRRTHLALRTACRAWRDRADLALAAHLRITPHPDRTDIVRLNHPVVRVWPLYFQVRDAPDVAAGRLPDLGPDAALHALRLLRAATAIDVVGPVSLQILEEMRHLLGSPVVRCVPAPEGPNAGELPVSKGVAMRCSCPGAAPYHQGCRERPQFACAIGCGPLHETGFGVLTSRAGVIDACRWVGVATFSSHEVPARVNEFDGDRLRRAEYVFVVRRGKGREGKGEGVEQYKYARVISSVVRDLIGLWLRGVEPRCRDGTGNAKSNSAGPRPRLTLVGFNALPYAWWCGEPANWPGNLDEARDGDTEDGASGFLWRLLRGYIRLWATKLIFLDDPESVIAGVIDSLRVFTLEAYMEYLMRDRGLGARAVAFELGEGALDF